MDNLELRRLHSDLFMVYKICFGLVDVIANDFFSLNQSGNSTSGHNYYFLRTLVVSIYANMFSLKEYSAAVELVDSLATRF